MQRNDAIKLLAKLRETVEHPATEEGERTAALQRIQSLKAKWRIGQYEVYEELRRRRNKSSEDRRDMMIRFRCTREERRRINEAADAAGQSVSDFIRKTVLNCKELN